MTETAIRSRRRGTPSSHAFPCPICGRETIVSETRPNASGIRRRRRCSAAAECPGAITTQEISVRPIAGEERSHPPGSYVLVAGPLWARLGLVAQAILGATSIRGRDRIPRSSRSEIVELDADLDLVPVAEDPDLGAGDLAGDADP